MDFGKSEKYKHFSEKKFLLNIGVLYPKKNQLALLDMLALTDLELVLITASVKADYAKTLTEKAAALHHTERIHILETVTEKEKHFLLKKCAGYVHPSLAEGFGIPPLEAMYYGKPVFLSTATSLPETGGKEAYYFPTFDPVGMADIVEKGLQESFGNTEKAEKRKAHALRFSAESMAKKYMQLYQDLLD